VIGRVLDAEGRDVTEERMTVIPAGRTTGEKHEGEWLRVSRIEMQMVLQYRERVADRDRTPS